MAKYTNDDLAKKIEKIPEELIKRLDDRYLKKDDADKEYITRREGAIAAGLLTFGATVLGLLISSASTINNIFRGN